MVVSDTVPWRIVLKLHAPMLSLIAGCAVVISALDRFGGVRIAASPTPFQVVGVALAILIGFRNNAAYDRWWEGRKLWGGIINASRAWSRQVTTLVDDADARALLHRQIAWCHALAAQLRGEDAVAAAAPFLDPAEAAALRAARNVPTVLLQAQSRAVVAAGPSEERLARLDATLVELANLQGGCERIRNTALPVAYRFFTRQFTRGYCLLLPFGMVEHLGAATVIGVVLMALVFLVVETVGSLLQDPFTRGVYGLPLSAISRTIEIDLRQAGGETDLPAPLAPEDRGAFSILL